MISRKMKVETCKEKREEGEKDRQKGKEISAFFCVEKSDKKRKKSDKRGKILTNLYELFSVPITLKSPINNRKMFYKDFLGLKCHKL